MEDAITLKDIFQIIGGVIVVVGAWSAIKYQGVANAKDLEVLRLSIAESLKAINKSNSEQWKKINIINEEMASIRERIVQAISMETAEKKFVTKEMFDLRMKQFDVDLKQTKGIAQNTLDAVQTLNSAVNSRS